MEATSAPSDKQGESVQLESKYHKAVTHYNELIQTLPKEIGWFGDLQQYKGFWLTSPAAIKGIMFIEHHFKSRPEDIILASSPKSGTTWLKSLLFATMNRNSFQFSQHPLLTSNPHEFFVILELFLHRFSDTDLEAMPSPRLFSTHLPYTLFPHPVTSCCRFVYVCRDPKDAFVSKWHFTQKIRPKEMPPLSFNEAFDMFCNGVTHYGPLWDNVLSYWNGNLEAPDKVLFLKYEDLKAEPVVQVKRLAEFIGKPFTEEEESEGAVEEIVRLCSFKNLSILEVNKSTTVSQLPVKNSDFFRKGEVGDWKNHLVPEMAEKLDQITKEKLLHFGLTLGVESL